MPDEYDNATKRRIRETATRLFYEKSFEAVTLNDICRASGVNKHTFYYYFKSKDDLLASYYRFSWNLSPDQVTAILTADNCVDQLWLTIQGFISQITTVGVSIVRQIVIRNLTDDMGTFHLGGSMAELLRLQGSIVQRGQQSGQFRNQADAKALIVLLQQTVVSSCMIWTVFQGKFNCETYVRFLMETLMEADESYRATTEESVRDFVDLLHSEAAAKPQADRCCGHPRPQHREG
ncbi:TetR/AcrR family transcriptional regulator [Caproiciproducens sp.]